MGETSPIVQTVRGSVGALVSPPPPEVVRVLPLLPPLGVEGSPPDPDGVEPPCDGASV